MKKISLIASACLLSTSVLASTVDEAFKNGKVEGSIAVAGIKRDNKAPDVKDIAFGNGNLTLAYTTGDFYGFNLKTEVKGNLNLGEKDKGDRKTLFENNGLITQAYIQYELSEIFSAKVGRYAGEYEWLSDYQQGAVAELLAIPDTVVAVGFSDRMATSEIDESQDFHRPNSNIKRGVYFVDVKNSSIDSFEINPYYYKIPQITQFYGLKLALDTDYFGAVTQYAKTKANDGAFLLDENGNSEDVEDGSIAHIELTGKVDNFVASVGFAKTDKENGVAGMDLFGDSISPFEEGNKVYDANSKTLYTVLGYTIGDLELGAVYGFSKYSDNNRRFKEKELDLAATYNITDSLSVSAMYVNVDTNNSADTDYDKYLAVVEYSF